MAGKDYVNLFYLTYDSINAIKKKDLVDCIEKMKDKIVADNHIQNICNEITNLSDKVNNLVSTNEILTSELSIVKNVNNILENKIVNIKKQLDLQENIVKICKDSNINISPMDLECCHRLPLRRNSTNATKQLIVKFVNKEHSEAMLQRKKDKNSKNKVFVTDPICPYYRSLWGKCKDLQRKSRINQVFCLRAIENSLTIKILHERDLMVYQECPTDSE